VRAGGELVPSLRDAIPQLHFLPIINKKG